MRILIGVTLSVIFSFTLTEIGHAAPDISASQAILMDQNSGEILYDKHSFEERPIASITKIMTALLAIESGKLNEEVTVSRKAIYTEGSSIYLEQGEKIKLNDLVYGLMLRSGNDAAVAIAEHVGKSEEGFVYLMNEKATWLGMNRTSFQNPHGLDADGHFSSAHDMAILTKEAMKNEVFQKISGSKNFLSDYRSYSWHNKHKLITGYYSHTTGGKTGYTRRTGRTLVTTAENDGHSLIVVTLNGPNDWNDHISLFEWGFAVLKEREKEEFSDEWMKEIKTETVPFNEKNSFYSLMTEAFRQLVGMKQW